MKISRALISVSDKKGIASFARELERQGQVYFLHNRVQSIERVREKIVDLVPNARVEIALLPAGKRGLQLLRP